MGLARASEFQVRPNVHCLLHAFITDRARWLSFSIDVVYRYQLAETPQELFAVICSDPSFVTIARKFFTDFDGTLAEATHAAIRATGASAGATGATGASAVEPDVAPNVGEKRSRALLGDDATDEEDLHV